MIAKGQTSGKPCRMLNSRISLQVCFFSLILYIWFRQQSGKMDKNRFPPPAVINSIHFSPPVINKQKCCIEQTLSGLLWALLCSGMERGLAKIACKYRNEGKRINFLQLAVCISWVLIHLHTESSQWNTLCKYCKPLPGILAMSCQQINFRCYFP